MQVTVNGKPHDLAGSLSVRALLEHLDLAKGPVAVEINRVIVPRAEHPQTMVTEGDAIEIVHLVGGG